MTARLGNVVYWGAILFAALMVGGAVWDYAANGTLSLDGREALGWAFALFVIGRAIRYVLAGP